MMAQNLANASPDLNWIDMRLFACLLATLAVLTTTNTAAYQLTAEENYPFPLHNPFVATVLGTPPELQPTLIPNDKIKQRDYRLRLRPERERSLPGNFWPVKTLTYRLARQKGTAPLIFIIAGTGASYASDKTEYLKRLFYTAGFHVVQISSPTSYDFMAAASAFATPGYSPQDAQELYHVMRLIRKKHKHLSVSHWYLTGYSLGGLHAAFISYLDSTQAYFDFKRVLLLNPPVNLYTSIRNLDQMANVQLPELYAGHNFYQDIFDKLARYFKKKGHFNLDQAILSDLQNSSEQLTDAQMAMLIGTMFRFIAADISFTSDLINRRGLITPRDTQITNGASLTPFLEQALLCDFTCYMREQLFPYWQTHFQGNNLNQLIEQTSLYAVAEHLKRNKNLAVMHNQDDIILGPGDLGFLQDKLHDRLLLYPYGGHMGNLNFTINARDIVDYFNDSHH